MQRTNPEAKFVVSYAVSKTCDKQSRPDEGLESWLRSISAGELWTASLHQHEVCMERQGHGGQDGPHRGFGSDATATPQVANPRKTGVEDPRSSFASDVCPATSPSGCVGLRTGFGLVGFRASWTTWAWVVCCRKAASLPLRTRRSEEKRGAASQVARVDRLQNRYGKTSAKGSAGTGLRQSCRPPCPSRSFFSSTPQSESLPSESMVLKSPRLALLPDPLLPPCPQQRATTPGHETRHGLEGPP